MRQSETQELRAIFIERIGQSFARAHRCMTFARIARVEGDNAGVDRWLWRVRAMRKAAARWRLKAQSPIVCLLLLCLVGCATPPPVTVGSLTIPYQVIQAVCMQYHPDDGHWDRRAIVLRDKQGYIVGLACTYAVRGASLRDVTISVDIGDAQAEPLRTFLDNYSKKNTEQMDCLDKYHTAAEQTAHCNMKPLP